MLKKFSVILISFILILGMCSNVNAQELKTSFDIIQKASETKYLDNDQGNISKTIVDSNKDTGEITVELKLNNMEKEVETEVYLIVPENITGQNGNLSETLNITEKLANGILNKNTKTKIGVIGTKGPTSLEEGGTDKDAEIVVKPTRDVEGIKNGIKNMNPSKNTYYDNMQASIRLASKSYSSNKNKVLISLYDSVIWSAIGITPDMDAARKRFCRYS